MKLWGLKDLWVGKKTPQKVFGIYGFSGLQLPVDLPIFLLKPNRKIFLKEFSTKMKIGRKWVSEYSEFLHMFLLGIETTLKNSNNYFRDFRRNFAKMVFPDFFY